MFDKLENVMRIYWRGAVKEHHGDFAWMFMVIVIYWQVECIVCKHNSRVHSPAVFKFGVTFFVNTIVLIVSLYLFPCKNNEFKKLFAMTGMLFCSIILSLRREHLQKLLRIIWNIKNNFLKFGLKILLSILEYGFKNDVIHHGVP